MDKVLKIRIPLIISYKSFKTEYLHKNHLWLIGTCFGLRSEGKQKWGHLRTTFATSRYRYLEVVNIFMNISAKTKIFSNIFWDIHRGTRYYQFMKKLGLESIMILSL